MTQEDKELLLKDICARLPYGIKCSSVLDDGTYGGLLFRLSDELNSEHLRFSDIPYAVRPYLRPMSSMTDGERKEYESFIFTQHHEWDGHGTSTKYVEADDAERYVTWLNKKMFDYNGLIPMGLALVAKEGMYV